jgi:hypothetical protein
MARSRERKRIALVQDGAEHAHHTCACPSYQEEGSSGAKRSSGEHLCFFNWAGGREQVVKAG